MENNQYSISHKTPFSANGEQEFETRDSAVRSEHHADTIPYTLLHDIIISQSQIEGNNHRQRSQSCEDVMFIRSTPDFLFCGIADSQSNTKYGMDGGYCCLDAIFNYISTMGIGNLFNTSFPDELPCMFVQEFRRKLLALAESRNAELKELSATLLAIVIDLKSKKYMTLHIGDGCALGVQNTGDISIISAPDNGASLYHTWLTTSLNAVSHFRITFGTLKYGMRILLMSDGATCFCKGRNISRQAKELIRNGSPSELQSHLLNSNPSDDASCIILDCIDNHLMP